MDNIQKQWKAAYSEIRKAITECEETAFRIGGRYIYNRNDCILCRFNGKEVELRDDTWSRWSNTTCIGEPPYWGLKHSW